MLEENAQEQDEKLSLNEIISFLRFGKDIMCGLHPQHPNFAGEYIVQDSIPSILNRNHTDISNLKRLALRRSRWTLTATR